jgi:hypothetical protein
MNFQSSKNSITEHNNLAQNEKRNNFILNKKSMLIKYRGQEIDKEKQ